MFKRIMLILFILFLTQTLFAQISVSKSNVDYSIQYKKANVIRTLTFWKDKDSTTYSSVKYSISDFNSNPKEKVLTKEISFIDTLWQIAEDSISINLQSFNIGYPLLYNDILKNHISAFLNSEKWQNHVKQNGKKLDYDIIKKVMQENNVYEPLNNFLYTKSYTSTGFETEKHGFVTKENLIKLGFKGNEIVPMPFIVYMKVAIK